MASFDEMHQREPTRRSPRFLPTGTNMTKHEPHEIPHAIQSPATFLLRRPPPLQVQTEPSQELVQITHTGAYVVGDVQIDGNGYTLGSDNSHSRNSASSRASASPLVYGDSENDSMALESPPLNFRVERLSDLQVCDRICGQGASGRVRLANHVPSATTVALKEVSLDQSYGKSECVVGELKALHDAKCTYIVSFYGAFYQNPTLSLVMEYMDEGSLLDVSRRCENNAIPEPILSEITRQILEGLAYLHLTSRIVHRDIKPSNILLNSKGQVKIADFGVSGRIGRHMHNKDTFVGTVSYMSPERLLGQKHSFDADIWSVGVLLLECAMGYYPYRARERRAKSTSVFWDGINRTSDRMPELPPEGFSNEFRSFVGACIRKSPNQRPAAFKLLRHPFVSQSKCSQADLRHFLRNLNQKGTTSHRLTRMQLRKQQDRSQMRFSFRS